MKANLIVSSIMYVTVAFAQSDYGKPSSIPNSASMASTAADATMPTSASAVDAAKTSASPMSSSAPVAAAGAPVPDYGKDSPSSTVQDAATTSASAPKKCRQRPTSMALPSSTSAPKKCRQRPTTTPASSVSEATTMPPSTATPAPAVESSTTTPCSETPVQSAMNAPTSAVPTTAAPTGAAPTSSVSEAQTMPTSTATPAPAVEQPKSTPCSETPVQPAMNSPTSAAPASSVSEATTMPTQSTAAPAADTTASTPCSHSSVQSAATSAPTSAAPAETTAAPVPTSAAPAQTTAAPLPPMKCKPRPAMPSSTVSGAMSSPTTVSPAMTSPVAGSSAPAYGTPAAPVAPVASPGCNQTATMNGTAAAAVADAKSTCPANASIGAVLFELPEFAGAKHWIDASNGSFCRGLNGTNVGSIEILTKPGGDPIQARAAAAYANSITIVFYSDFGCKNATEVLKSTGNQRNVPSLNGVAAKSARIICEPSFATAAASGNITAPAGQQFHFAIQKKTAAGVPQTSFQDAFVNQCVGGEGIPVTGIQYVKSPGAPVNTSSIPDSEASQVKLVFFDQNGCLGGRGAEVVGNAKTVCPNGKCPSPKSYMLMSVNSSKVPVFKDNSAEVKQTAASVSGASSLIATSGLMMTAFALFL